MLHASSMAPAASTCVEPSDEGDGLHRLAQPHLISQHYVDGRMPRVPQPVETLKLVGVQLLRARAWLSECGARESFRGEGGGKRGKVDQEGNGGRGEGKQLGFGGRGRAGERRPVCAEMSTGMSSERGGARLVRR